jgi:hypothetical protein
MRPRIIYLLVWAVIVLVSITVHEMGHALVGRRYGMRRQRIYLYSTTGTTRQVCPRRSSLNRRLRGVTIGRRARPGLTR